MSQRGGFAAGLQSPHAKQAQVPPPSGGSQQPQQQLLHHHPQHHLPQHYAHAHQLMQQHASQQHQHLSRTTGQSPQPQMAKVAPDSPYSPAIYSNRGTRPPLPPRMTSPMIDPMDDGDDDDMLTPEEEALVGVREFGKADRLNAEAKQMRLMVLNSQFPTRQDMQAAIDVLGSSAGKGLLSMATSLHDQLEELITEELAEKTTKLCFNPKPEFNDDDDAEEEPAGETFETAMVPSGPKTTIGILLADRPEAAGLPKRCMVHGSVPGSPAYLSGKVKPGDVLVQVDGEDVGPENVVSKMRGNDVTGTRIKLLVERQGRRRPFAVHLIRASREVVDRKKKVFELLATLAQAAGASSLQQDAEQDNSAAALHRKMIAQIRELERENMEEEIILREQADRMTRALRQAQILVLEFLSKGHEILQSEACSSAAVASERPPYNHAEPNTSQEGLKSSNMSPNRSGWLRSLLSRPASTTPQEGMDGMGQEVEAIGMSVMPVDENPVATSPVKGGGAAEYNAAGQPDVLNSQASEAAKNLQDAQEQLKDAEARCKKLTEENEMLLHSLHESMAVLEEMRGQAQDKVEVQMLYDAAKQANDTQCAALQERLDVLSERCTSLQERCDTLSTQREELLLAVSSAEQDATSAMMLLEAEKAHHGEATANLKEMLASSENVIQDGSKRFETLASELDSMRTAIAGKDAEIHDLTAQVSEMEDQLEEQQTLYTQAISSAETALVEAQRRQRELTQEKTTLEMALREAMDEQQRLESELRTAQKDSEQTTKLRTEAEEAMALLEAHLEELQRVMEEKISHIEQERAKIEQERDHALRQLADATSIELESSSSAGASSVKGQASSVGPSASSAGASSVKGQASSSSTTKSPTKTTQAPRLVANNPPFGFGGQTMPFIQYPGGTMRR